MDKVSDMPDGKGFFMKKWIAPILVLALAVLFILCGKHITETIMNRPPEQSNRNSQYYIAEISPPGDILSPDPENRTTHLILEASILR